MPDKVEVEKSLVVIVPPPPRPFEEPTNLKALEAKPKGRRAARYKIPRKENDKPTNLGPISHEIPKITIHINEAPLVKTEGSAVFDHSQVLQAQSNGYTSIDPSTTNTITLRLVTDSAESLPPLAPVDGVPTAPNGAISPTSSKNYILPKLPDRKLTLADSGIIQDFLDAAMDIVNDGEYQPPICAPPELTVDSHDVDMEIDDLYRIEHSPCSDTGPVDRLGLYDVGPSLSHVGNMEIDELYERVGSINSETSPTNGQVAVVAQRSFVDTLPHLLPSTSEDTQTAVMDTNIQPKSIMTDEGLDDMVLATDIIDPVLTSAPAKEVTKETSMDAFPDYVPSAIPEELLALVDSYLFGRPVTIMLSNEYLQKHWSLALPNEYKYAMMGYFRILGIQVRW